MLILGELQRLSRVSFELFLEKIRKKLEEQLKTQRD